MAEAVKPTMRLNVVDREGIRHAVETPASGSLMEALRDYGVAAICGGMCSCATCHVYIAEDWIARLPSRRSDEHELISELQHHRQASRLGCQIKLHAALDGLCVTLAPEE